MEILGFMRITYHSSKNLRINLFENKGMEKQFKVIEQLLSSAPEIINCGDAGHEGEVIQRWDCLKAKKTAPIKRLG